MTYDRGREMARHEELSERTGLKVYFAHPHSPWERGRNENTNGLLRQYLINSKNTGQHQQKTTLLHVELEKHPSARNKMRFIKRSPPIQALRGHMTHEQRLNSQCSPTRQPENNAYISAR